MTEESVSPANGSAFPQRVTVNDSTPVTSTNVTASPRDSSEMHHLIEMSIEDVGEDPKHYQLFLENPNIAEQEDRLRVNMLKCQRKLALIVDLDMTLVHTSIDPFIAEWMESYNKAMEQAFHGNSTKEYQNQNQKLSSRHVFNNVVSYSGIAKIILDNDRSMPHFCKIRPGVAEFLESAAELFELSIYTMGTRPYAAAVARLLDPNGTLFSDRIFSREGNDNLTQKMIQRVFPCDTSMVVILDDRFDVWRDSSANLVKIHPYTFYKENLLHGIRFENTHADVVEDLKSGGLQLVPNIEYKEWDIHAGAVCEHSSLADSHIQLLLNESDDELVHTMEVLRRIHRKCYPLRYDGCAYADALPRHADVKTESLSFQLNVAHFVTAMKREVLENVVILFGDIWCEPNFLPVFRDIWSLAELYGARCTAQLDDDVTHIVWLFEELPRVPSNLSSVHVVQLKWLTDSLSRWTRALEDAYRLKTAFFDHCDNGEDLRSVSSQSENSLGKSLDEEENNESETADMLLDKVIGTNWQEDNGVVKSLNMENFEVKFEKAAVSDVCENESAYDRHCVGPRYISL